MKPTSVAMTTAATTQPNRGPLMGITTESVWVDLVFGREECSSEAGRSGLRTPRDGGSVLAEEDPEDASTPSRGVPGDELDLEAPTLGDDLDGPGAICG